VAAIEIEADAWERQCAAERLQKERASLEGRLALLEDGRTAASLTTEQHIQLREIREDIERVEREAELLLTRNQVCTA
jgi:hypothetical protein